MAGIDSAIFDAFSAAEFRARDHGRVVWADLIRDASLAHDARRKVSGRDWSDLDAVNAAVDSTIEECAAGVGGILLMQWLSVREALGHGFPAMLADMPGRVQADYARRLAWDECRRAVGVLLVCGQRTAPSEAERHYAASELYDHESPPPDLFAHVSRALGSVGCGADVTGPWAGLGDPPAPTPDTTRVPAPAPQISGVGHDDMSVIARLAKTLDLATITTVTRALVDIANNVSKVV